MRKAITILIIVSLALSLVACSNSKEKNEIRGEIIYLRSYECKVGYIVQFGPYLWRILDIKDDNVLLISEEILTSRPFYSNPSSGNKTWADSELRKWLNREFLDVFSDEEISRIINTRVINSEDPSGDDDTKDKIFLLSVDEVTKYFSTNKERRARYKELENLTEWYAWMTRTVSLIDTYVCQVDLAGKVNSNTLGISGGGVRPAMWLKIK